MTTGLRHLGADIWAQDIWAQTLGRETFGRRHLGAKTLGRKDIWAQRHLGTKCILAHFQQSFSTSSKKKFLQKFYMFNGVSVLIFSNFLVTTSNKRTN